MGVEKAGMENVLSCTACNGLQLYGTLVRYVNVDYKSLFFGGKIYIYKLTEITISYIKRIKKYI